VVSTRSSRFPSYDYAHDVSFMPDNAPPTAYLSAAAISIASGSLNLPPPVPNFSEHFGADQLAATPRYALARIPTHASAISSLPPYEIGRLHRLRNAVQVEGTGGYIGITVGNRIANPLQGMTRWVLVGDLM